MSADTLGQLSAAGVSVWLDDISRDRLRTGNLQELIDGRHVVGVTSNPTIFAHAVDHGNAYDGQLADLKTRGVTVEEASRAITTYDIRWACDVLRPVYDATGGLDGRVSIEVDPRVANDTPQDHRRGAQPVVDGGPAEPVHQDPRHARRAARDHAGHLGGDQRQRHADLLAAAVRRGHRRLPGGPGAGPGSRARPVPDPLGGVLLRQPDGYRGRFPAGQAGHPGGDGAARQGGHRERPAGLRAVRAAVRRGTLAGAAGQRGADPAAAVGLDVHEGPGTSPTPCT